MDDAEMDAENALVADLAHMAQAIQTGLKADEGLTVWKARREEIAALRQRIRAMRARHLGRPTSAPRVPSHRP